MEADWNAFDSAGWAGAFAPDVDFVNIFGGYHHGRDHVQKSHQNLFTGVYADSHNELTVEKVRPIGPDLYSALVFTRLAHKKGVHDGRMTMLLQDKGDTFEILWFHNTFVTTPAHHASQAESEKGRPSYNPMSSGS
jgi:uncharacterized protein (TIGR02246 family)